MLGQRELVRSKKENKYSPYHHGETDACKNEKSGTYMLEVLQREVIPVVSCKAKQDGEKAAKTAYPEKQVDYVLKPFLGLFTEAVPKNCA